MTGPSSTSAALPVSDPERTLIDLGIEYRRRADGTLFVPGNVELSGQGLTALPDLTGVHVHGYFSCSDNALTSFRGAPKIVEGFFFCGRNRLESFDFAPERVGSFLGADNRFASLAGAPETETSFDCSKNPLTYLEHAPRSFTRLHSDLGNYDYWEEIPEALRVSPETRAREERERQEKFEQGIRDAVALPQPLKLNKPFRFR